MFKNRSRHIGRVAVVVPVFLALLVMSGCSRDPNVRKRKYLESGKRYESEGKLKEAFIQFSNALKVDKTYSDAHYELAKTYFKMGDPRSGYGQLMQTVTLAPGNLQARVDLGSLLLAGNAVDRAEEQAKAVIAANPNNADGYALLSSIAARKNDRAGALSNIQHAISIDPNRSSFHTTLALIYSSDPETAASSEGELQKAISLDAKDVHARIVMAALLERKGDRPGAEQQYITAIQADPKDIPSRAGLAGLYLREGDKAKAEQTARKAVEENPDSEQASTLLKDYYSRTGQPDVAETVFADLSTKNPKSFPIKLNYGEILSARGKFDQLSPLVDQMAKTNGTQPQVVLLRSTILLHNNKMNDAVDLLESAAKSSPQNPQLQLALARTAMLDGNVNLSEQSYRAGEKLLPGNLDIEIGLAQVATRKNDTNMLGQVADKTIAAHPDFAEAYVWRGSVEASQKQFDKAETDFQTAVTKGPNNPAGYLELGQLRLRAQKFPEAITMYEKALEKDPNSAIALGQIVNIYMNQKQPAKAIARVQQQLTAAPKNSGFYTMLATLQLNTKDTNGARTNAKKAMDLDSNNERAVELYAQTYSTTGDNDTAIGIWQQWQTAHPKDAAATSMLGLLEEAKGDQIKAMEYYRKTMDLDPNQGLAANNLAYLMVQNGQSADMALTYAQTARRTLPNSPDTADTLAWVDYYKGTYLTARDLLEDATKQSPNSASIHYHLGMTYSKLGRRADAIVQLKKAVELAPNTQISKDAQAALTQLS